MNIHRLCQYPYSGTFPTGTPLSLKKEARRQEPGIEKSRGKQGLEMSELCESMQCRLDTGK